MSKLIDALTVLAVAGLGIVFALLVFGDEWILAAAIAAALILASLALSAAGNRTLGRNRPSDALRTLEWGVFLRAATIAAAGGVALIALAVGIAELTADDEVTKAVVAAASSAGEAFITAVLLPGADSPDESWLGPRVKAAFQSKLKDAVVKLRPPGGPATQAEIALTGDNWGGGGWDAPGRRARARVIEDALAAGTATNS